MRGCAPREQILGGACPKLRGILRRILPCRAQEFRSVRRNHHSGKMQLTVEEMRVGAHRQLASAPERGKYCAFASHGLKSRQIIQGRDDLTGFILGSRLNRECALPGRRTHVSGLEQLCNFALKAEAPQAGRRQQNCVVLAFPQFAQPRIDIAANRLDAQLGTHRAQLGGAAAGTGPDRAQPWSVRPAASQRAHRADLRAPESLRSLNRPAFP